MSFQIYKKNIEWGMNIFLNGAMCAILINLFFAIAYFLSFIIVGGLFELTRIENLFYLSLLMIYAPLVIILFIPSFFIRKIFLMRQIEIVELFLISLVSLICSLLLFYFFLRILESFNFASAVALGFLGIPIGFAIAVLVGHIIGLFYEIMYLRRQIFKH